MRSIAACLVLLLTTLAFAADDNRLRVLPESETQPVNRMLKRYLIEQCKERFEKRKGEIAALKSAEDVIRRQTELRAHFLAAIQEPTEKTPLEAVVLGRILGNGYHVEKVIYQSRPEHHITASLYLPEGKGPFPGVIMPIGHSLNGKAADYMQRGCILLAKHGIAALAYDPIGQGERRQMIAESGEPAVKGSTNEHTLTTVGALLVGRSTAGYRIWDGIRSLDYLESRPEIDPKRLGCTGCSGGGTLTSYLMALDPRIKAAAPSCYLTSLDRLFDTIGPQDAEQNIPGQVAFGMDHADYLLLHAPQPVVMLAAKQDFFDITGTRTTYDEAKRIYRLFGQPENIQLVESDTKHGYPKQHREPAVKFLQRWLLDRDEEVKEGDLSILKDAELQCTTSGQVLAEFRGRSVFDLTRLRADELAGVRASKSLSDENFRAELCRLLGCRSTPILAAKSADRGTAEHQGRKLQRVSYETEPGIEVPALWLKPAEKGEGTVIVVHERGKEEVLGSKIVKELLDARRTVIAVDLRGWGETAPGTAGPGLFGPDVTETFLALHLNRPLLGQRVHDLVSVIQAVKKDAPGEIEVIGIGAGGLVALHAAALEPDAIQSLTLDGSLARWHDVCDQPLGPQQFAHVVPGALAIYDLPELVARLKTPRITIRRPADAFAKSLASSAAKETYAVVKRDFKLDVEEAESK